VRPRWRSLDVLMLAIPFHCSLPGAGRASSPLLHGARGCRRSAEGSLPKHRNPPAYTSINLATRVVQRGKDLTEQPCALESGAQLQPAFLHWCVGREATATQQSSGQGTGPTVLCSGVLGTHGRCAIDSGAADAQNHGSQTPVRSAHVAANFPSLHDRFGASGFV